MDYQSLFLFFTLELIPGWSLRRIVRISLLITQAVVLTLAAARAFGSGGSDD